MQINSCHITWYRYDVQVKTFRLKTVYFKTVQLVVVQLQLYSCTVAVVQLYNCISCVNNCEDLLYIYFFFPQFKYMSFIYSQFHLVGYYMTLKMFLLTSALSFKLFLVFFFNLIFFLLFCYVRDGNYTVESLLTTMARYCLLNVLT